MSAPAEVRPHAPSAGPDSGLLLAGRYELGDVCGVGGFARVYQARDRRLATMVAVKLLDAVPDEATRARFAREVEISASIVHPNLIRITDTSESSGGSSSGAPPAICGNGVHEPGEECDDGRPRVGTNR